MVWYSSNQEWDLFQHERLIFFEVCSPTEGDDV